MRIYSIDPGLTIGYAWYDTETKHFDALQTSDPHKIIQFMDLEVDTLRDNIFIVENYISAGTLTKEAMTTIKLVGFFELYIDRMYGDVTLQAPQKRLSGVARAVQMIGDGPLKMMHRNGRDAVAALAHALVAARTYEG